MANDDVSTYVPQDPVQFGFAEASDFAARLRRSATLVTVQQLPRRGQLARTARVDWQGTFAENFDTRVAQCRADAVRLNEALRDAADKVEQLAEEAQREQERRDRANEYLREHAAWRERQDDVVRQFVTLGFGDDEPEAPEMTGEPSTLPAMDPNVAPRVP